VPLKGGALGFSISYPQSPIFYLFLERGDPAELVPFDAGGGLGGGGGEDSDLVVKLRLSKID
jgi:hypothetical protein